MNRSERLMAQRKKAEARGMEQRRSLGDGRNFRTGPQPGIAGAFQGINPARAGYDVGNAAIMANQQQAQPQKQVTAADIQKRMQDIYSSPTGQAMTLRNTYLNNPGLVNPNIPQSDYAALGFSPEAAAARQAFDKQQQQMGVDFRTQLMNTNSSTKAAELMQQYTTNLGNADQQFLQQNPAFAQQAQENMMRSGQFNQAQQDSMRQQMQQLQNLNMQGGMGGMPGQLYGQAQLANQFANQGDMGLKPQGNTGTGFNLGSGPYGSAPSLAMPIINPQQPSVTSVNLPGMGGQPLGAQPAGQQQMGNMFGGMQQQFGKAY